MVLLARLIASMNLAWTATTLFLFRRIRKYFGENEVL
jgi:hypothetical protein